MIINIRGTSGSGKSTIVREIMKQYPTVCKVKEDGRKRPLSYSCVKPMHRPLMVLGHYETPCGGCDTITSMDKIYALVRHAHEEGYDVLYEGLLLSAEVNRCQQLHEDGLPLLVIGLDVPLQECIDSVNARRWAKDPEKPGVNPKNTESKHKGTKRSMERFKEAGVQTAWCCRDGSVVLIKDMLVL